ncbi:hypothetical protein VTI74DRAFT_7077 [Chaetomium olivicolor]
MRRALTHFTTPLGVTIPTQTRFLAISSRPLLTYAPRCASPISSRAPTSHANYYSSHHRLFHISPLRCSPTSSNNTTTQQPPKPARLRPRLTLLLLSTAALITALYLLADPFTPPKPLNPTTFVPYTITAREQVSSTAFIITVAPKNSPLANAEVLKQAWEHGLWSVEVKQPQLQVARDYTPLPSSPLLEDGAGNGGDGEMRFYIRRMDGGEVSSYLSRLGVGDTVELRGPKLGFDVRRRAGIESHVEGEGDKDGEEKRKKVVFLAGGTGIAPALQAARALLEKSGEGVDMEVVWANRRREDCLGCEGGEQQGAVVAMLEGYRRRYRGRFKYSCTVDEEGSFIDAGMITGITGVSTSAGKASSWWPFGGTAKAEPLPAVPLNSDACTYHSPKRLVVSDDRDASAYSETEGCQCKDMNGNPAKGSKNLLFFSGPDGFIAHYAGAKVWGGGKELQGPVKGVVGDLKRKYPSLRQNWLVLKM